MAQTFIFVVTYFYYWLLIKTMRIEAVGRQRVLDEMAEGRSPVFASAHTVLLTSIMSFDGQPATLLASRSGDGEIIAKILLRRGFQVIRGSSNRGAAVALAKLIRSTKQGQAIGIAYDGPKGPPLIPKGGIATVAKLSRGSVYFMKTEVLDSFFPGLKLCIRLGSWDRFLLPLPFCRIRVTFDRVEEKCDRDTPGFEDFINTALLEKGMKEYAHLYAKNGATEAKN